MAANQDTELFELCKDVYERTGWETVIPYNRVAIVNKLPLYTSDYLLEKLSPFAHTNRNQVSVFSSGNKSTFDDWSAVFVENWADEEGQPQHKRTAESHADTPLKALLKLTIALHEAGEL